MNENKGGYADLITSAITFVSGAIIVIRHLRRDPQIVASWQMHIARAFAGVALAFGSAGLRWELRARQTVEDARL